MSKKAEDIISKDFVTEGDDVCIAMDAEMFRDLFNLMSALIDTEVQVMIEDEGLRVKQMEEVHVALTDMFVPKTYFRELKAGQKINELRLPVSDIKAVLSRLSGGDIVKFTVTKDGKLHVEIEGKRLRAFNLPLFESEKLDKRTPRISFNARIKTTMEGVLLCIEDAEKLLKRGAKKKESYLAQIKLITTAMGLSIISESESGLYSTEGTLTSGWDIMQFDGKLDQRVMMSISYLIDVVKTVSKVTNVIQIEMSTDMPLHIIVELPLKGVNLEYWFAPRIEVREETKETVPEKEVG